MPNLRIRIGASVEADFGALIFRPLVEQAKAARAAVRRELDGIGQDVARIGGKAGKSAGGGGYRTNAPGGDDGGLKETAKVRQRAHREIESEDDRHDREMTARERRRNERREQNRRDNQVERARNRVAESTVHNFGGLARRGTGIAADIARGAGVDFSLGSAAKSRFELEKRSVDLSNAAFMPGDKGVAGKRQDPRAIMDAVQSAADATALDTGKAMEGLQAFVGKTGDLATGKAALGDMAKLARATGGELQDIVSAAGDVAANLGEVGDKFKTPEEKAKAVTAVMQALAAQGKVGAVEMKDLSVQMAKLASSAPQFAGSVEENMMSMGALAQGARAKGGAASATQAATSVQGFVNTFGKKARRQEFKNAGVQIEDSAGMLLNPEEILVNSLKATGGSKSKMNKLFMDASAQRVTNGFRNIYTQAEQKEKGSGEAAVRAEFAKYKKTMGKDELDASFKASMGTNEAQAQLLKNKLEKELGSAVEKLAPALLKLAPDIVEVSQAFGQLVNWAATHKWQAAFTAFGASVLKSVGEEFMRNATSAMFGGGIGGGSGGKAGGGLGVMGNIGAAFAITAAAVTIAQVGMLAIDKVVEAEHKKKFKEDADQLNVDTRLVRAKEKRDEVIRNEGGIVSQKGLAAEEEFQEAKKAALQKLNDDIASGEKAKSGEGTGQTAAILNSIFGPGTVGGGETIDQRGAALANEMKLDALRDQMARVESVLSGTLKVTVDNMPGPGAPGVNPRGRTGPDPGSFGGFF